MKNEKRLIAYDPITFESFTRHATKHIDPYYDPYGEGFTDAVDNIEGWLKNNTVDAVEVVHGRWVLREKAGADYWCCTACDRRISEYWAEPKYNYCPNCGAKMDGDTE